MQAFNVIKRKMENLYRLPTTITPKKYELKIEPIPIKSNEPIGCVTTSSGTPTVSVEPIGCVNTFSGTPIKSAEPIGCVNTFSGTPIKSAEPIGCVTTSSGTSIKSAEPIHSDYDIFKGHCKIHLNFHSNPNPKIITLNQIDLIIKQVRLKDIVDTNKKYKLLYTKILPKDEQVIFHFDDLPMDEGILEIDYEGKITTQPIGIYKAMQSDEIVICTQFEATDARRCFPCFDEPSFKATFQVEIIAPKDKTVLSNTDPLTVTPIGDNTKYLFTETPIMSTYLLCMYIGKADYVEDFSSSGVRIRVYSHKPAQTKFSLDVAIKCLDILEKFFEIKYPIGKLDLLSYPELAAGAMENFGLITFREKLLIIDPTMSITDKIDLAYTICHEIGHQWFGNLVTMEWWSNLWLNESFTTWVGWMVTDLIFPEWKVWEKFYSEEIVSGLNLDSMKNSHPIEVEVMNATEINEIFDAISYSKGSAVVKMLVKYIGEDIFRKGITYYLKKYAYQNATTTDLWNCLEAVSGKPIGNLMYSWTKQQGYPLVRVQLIDNMIRISQQIFRLTEDTDNTDDNDLLNQTWIIPLGGNLTLDSVQKSIEITVEEYHQRLGGFHINPNVDGFYRVFYDYNLMKKILTTDKLTTLDLAGILDDNYNLLRARKINYQHYLAVLGNILNLILILDLILILMRFCCHWDKNFWNFMIKNGAGRFRWAVGHRGVVRLGQRFGF